MGPRLHIESPPLRAGALSVSGGAYRYLARVLRLREGDDLVVFDGKGAEATARVARIDHVKRRVELELSAPACTPLARPALELTLLCSLLKGDRMDLVVQKATELGATRIWPVQAARSVVQLAGERARSRLSRWQTIAAEAARQCGRADVPEVAPVTELAGALARANADLRVAFHEEERARTLREALPPRPPASAAVLVGPEGGLAASEIEAARAAGFVVCGMGPRILRAETAALAAVAVLAFAVGDLGGPI